MNITSLDALQNLIDELKVLGIVEQYPDKSSVLTKDFYLHLYHTYGDLMMTSSKIGLHGEEELDVIIISLLSFLDKNPIFGKVKPTTESEWIYSASLLIYTYIKKDQSDSLKEYIAY